MRKFLIANAKPFKLYPSFQWMYAGYKGFNKGLCFRWFNKMVVLIRPINERN